MLAGIILISKVEWLRLVYFPSVIALTAFYRLPTVLPVSLLVPFLSLRSFLSTGTFMAEISFSAFLVCAAAISSAVADRFRRERERAVSSLDVIKDNARNIALESSMESLDREEITSHYFASILKTDEEIRELLLTVKHTVFADSVSLFIPQGKGLALRCTTDDKDCPIISDKGMIYTCIRERKVLLSDRATGKGIEPGYLKNARISSIITAPVLAGSTAAGVIAVDSSRYQAFSEVEKNTVRMFGDHIARVLGRERIYLMVKRDISGLKILKEESSNLVSSLHIDVIARKLCEGAGKLTPAQAFFFLSESPGFSLVHHTGTVVVEGSSFDLRDTLINMAIENRQHIYLSDVTDYKVPVMPFKTGEVRSIFIIPMFYENNLMGLFVMISENRGFLDTFQIDMMKVMCNQASTSIANAKLHAAIEKMATTDGLTGLFNHRLFQEKLSEEFRRSSRFPDPVSLLLTDIDYFKKVNDTYGHPVGDEVLREVSKVIMDTIRNIDIPARYGGEEFAIILPGADADGAKIIAERLRKAIMEKTFSGDGRSFQVTISIGIATSPSDAKSKEELIEKADQALYHAKHNGRNQSVLWGGVK